MVTEAMIGILYAGFASAVLFAKVWAAQGKAQVIFSDIMLLRYGNGVKQSEIIDNDDQYSSDSEADSSFSEDIEVEPVFSSESISRQHPSKFPILEFRIANETSQLTLEAKVSCVVSVVSSKERAQRKALREKVKTASFHKNSDRQNLREKVKKESFPKNTDRQNRDASQANPSVDRRKTMKRHVSVKDIIANLDKDHHLDSVLLENDNIFREVAIQCPHIPIFERVWTVVHVLDENSPLLRKKVREKIRSTHTWPTEYNMSPEDIRRSLRDFGSLHIIFQHVTHSGIVAFSHKRYEYNDLLIGYRFADIAYTKNGYDDVHIDRFLINDVIEQDGGGGEVINFEDDFN